MDNDKKWQEKLTFVSGTLLVFGLFLLSLWPKVATYQTSLNIRAWTMNYPQEGVNPKLWFFWCLAALLTIAILITLLSVIHILSRGIWLGIPSTDATLKNETNKGASILSDLCIYSYKTCFLLGFLFVGVLLLSALALLSNGFENWLTEGFYLSVGIAGWIARICVILVFFFLLWLAYKYAFFRSFYRFLKSSKLIPRNSTSVLFAFLILCLFVVENCNFLTVEVPRKIFIKGQDSLVEATIKAGGSTSDMSVSKIYFLDDLGNRISSLIPHDIGDGYYLAGIQVASLKEGDYHIVLEYPHMAFNETFPYIHPKIKISKGFVVVEKY